MTMYLPILYLVLECCKSFQNGNLSVDELQSCIRNAEFNISSSEESSLRKFFMLVENEIDYLRIMHNDDEYIHNDFSKVAYHLDNYRYLLPLVEKVVLKCTNIISKVSQ